ncbi:hypothetical protein K437DRAFT_275894 [Tilletiaria anomala UBC 951]|uniref:Uncharacterized protein n=1 Tax=Tilletiaria anomala (strain ATCC 24038 / CBS 436.72 / UBC 951) TaxID=1037660 RepID=A0A066VDQ4_TILAU|nr:uncharacterized protein K437DRAFT_275894 [Tilletiaria anomala UBC 951]KDN39837.1 hypothetical protein K437DRAFT_275894 [Tilletiaria anomala UBC 951]
MVVLEMSNLPKKVVETSNLEKKVTMTISSVQQQQQTASFPSFNDHQEEARQHIGRAECVNADRIKKPRKPTILSFLFQNQVQDRKAAVAAASSTPAEAAELTALSIADLPNGKKRAAAIIWATATYIRAMSTEEQAALAAENDAAHASSRGGASQGKELTGAKAVKQAFERTAAVV